MKYFSLFANIYIRNANVDVRGTSFAIKLLKFVDITGFNNRKVGS